MTRMATRRIARGCRRIVLAATILIACTSACAVERTPFTVVVLPDTQFYSERYPGTYLSQTAWIAATREQEHIAFVTHLGDLVQNHDRRVEWERADRAMRLLDLTVPYSACFGNHDLGSSHCTDFFGPARYAGRPWYLGADPGGHNHAQIFEAGGYRILHLNLEFGAGDKAVAWARSVAAEHAALPAILSTHDYLGLGSRTPTGERLWADFVSQTPRIFLVLNGHIHGEFWQVSENRAGGRVIEILSDYQDNPNGGEGDLRILRFDVAADRLEIETYSPLLDRVNASPAGRFGFDVEFGETIRVLTPVSRAPVAVPNRGLPVVPAAPAPVGN